MLNTDTTSEPPAVQTAKFRQLRGFSIALALALVLLAFEAGRMVLMAGLLVEIEGNLSPEEREQLNALIEPHARAGPWMLDAEDFAQDIGSLPWVGAVELRRLWFNSVSVKVSHSLTDRVSKLERTLENLQRDLARASNSAQRIRRDQIGGQGRTSEQSDLGNLFLAFDLLARDANLDIEELLLARSGDVRLLFAEGRELMLGNRDSLRRFSRFIRVYQAALKPQWSRVRAMDARYGDAVAVDWSEGGLIAKNDASSSRGESP